MNALQCLAGKVDNNNNNNNNTMPIVGVIRNLFLVRLYNAFCGRL